MYRVVTVVFSRHRYPLVCGLVEISSRFLLSKTHFFTHAHNPHADEAECECDGRRRVVKGHRKLMAAAILHGISSDTLDRFVCVSLRNRGRT